MHALTTCAEPALASPLLPLPHIATANRILAAANRPDFDKDLGWNANDDGNTVAQVLLLAAVARHEEPATHVIPSFNITAKHPKTGEVKTFSFEEEEVSLSGHNAEWHFAFGVFAQLIWAGFDPTQQYSKSPSEGPATPNLSFFELAESHRGTPGVAGILERTHTIHQEHLNECLKNNALAEFVRELAQASRETTTLTILKGFAAK